jgi:hypothetical protein
MFEWLVLHNRILTWENLMKRGFTGPSRCHLCEVKEETTDHLLDECNYTTKIWDWVACIYRQSNRVKGDIRETIKDWNERYNENEMVNLCWSLTSGMVIWAIWKERNMHIFRNDNLPTERLKDAIVSQIRETVQSCNHNKEKIQLTDQDSCILEFFYLKDWSYSIPVGREPQIQTGVHSWTPPRQGSSN